MSHFHLCSLRTYIVVISLPSRVSSVCVPRISGQSPLKRPVCLYTLCVSFQCTISRKQRLVTATVLCVFKSSHAFLLTCILTRAMVSDVPCSLYFSVAVMCKLCQFSSARFAVMWNICLSFNAECTFNFFIWLTFTAVVSAFLLWLHRC